MAWYPTAGWAFRKKITIDNTKVSGASHSSFPVLISRTDADIKAGAQADGDDILFTSADGTTKLDHELEKWDNGTGELVAWVRVPTLSGSVDTDLFVYYGNPGAASQQNPTGVWDSFYKMVHHMVGASATALDDSTANNHDVTGEGGDPTYDQAGKMAEAVEYDGNDNNDITTGADFDFGTGDFTISGWAYFTSSTDYRAILGSSTWAGGSDDLTFDRESNGGGNRLRLNFYSAVPTSYEVKTDQIPTLNQWVYCTVTRISGVTSLSVDGVVGVITGGNLLNGVTVKMSTDFHIASRNNVTYLIGKVDEVRVSKGIGRSVNWITTEYNNQNAPATFYSVGAEESFGSVLNRISGVLDRTASAVLVRVST